MKKNILFILIIVLFSFIPYKTKATTTTLDGLFEYKNNLYEYIGNNKLDFFKYSEDGHKQFAIEDRSGSEDFFKIYVADKDDNIIFYKAIPARYEPDNWYLKNNDKVVFFESDKYYYITIETNRADPIYDLYIFTKTGKEIYSRRGLEFPIKGKYKYMKIVAVEEEHNRLILENYGTELKGSNDGGFLEYYSYDWMNEKTEVMLSTKGNIEDKYFSVLGNKYVVMTYFLEEKTSIIDEIEYKGYYCNIGDSTFKQFYKNSYETSTYNHSRIDFKACHVFSKNNELYIIEKIINNNDNSYVTYKIYDTNNNLIKTSIVQNKVTSWGYYDFDEFYNRFYSGSKKLLKIYIRNDFSVTDHLFNLDSVLSQYPINYNTNHSHFMNFLNDRQIYLGIDTANVSNSEWATIFSNIYILNISSTITVNKLDNNIKYGDNSLIEFNVLVFDEDENNIKVKATIGNSTKVQTINGNGTLHFSFNTKEIGEGTFNNIIFTIKELWDEKIIEEKNIEWNGSLNIAFPLENLIKQINTYVAKKNNLQQFFIVNTDERVIDNNITNQGLVLQIKNIINERSGNLYLIGADNEIMRSLAKDFE